MSATASPAEAAGGGKGKRKLLMIVGGVLVLAIGGGWFSGIIPGMLGGHNGPETHAAASETGHDGAQPIPAHIFMDLPDIVTNLSNGSRRPSFIKLKAKLEVAQPGDLAIVGANMPRVLDLFQGYLREVRPEELRGAAGTYRLREALLSRVNIAAAPAHVLDVLFVELLVQ